MEKGRRSVTAERAALQRAAHQLFDRPRLVDDPVVLRLLGPECPAASAAPEHPVVRHLRAAIVVRSRFAEDALADAVRRGVGRYLILGAGLDTFAYRNPHPALRVFEVDHPDAQAWKRERLRAAAIEPPQTLTFVAVDFEAEPLAAALARGGVDPRAHAFVSWLGVTMYLTREAVLGTLAALSTLAPGSEVVFEYVVPPSSLGAGARVALAALAERGAKAGEPWITFFEPGALGAELRRLGFAEVEDVGPEEIAERYFRGRADGLRPGSAGRLVRARLPG